MSDTYAITSFYKFVPIDEAAVSALRDRLDELGVAQQMCGLTLLATEGINGTVAGTQSAVDLFEAAVTEAVGEIVFKNSHAVEKPFKRWHVKIREEIVGLKDPSIIPDGEHRHLSPAEWHRVLEEEDVVLIDTRNTYETSIGTFQGAVDPQLSTFSEFPEWVENCEIPKQKKVLMYCTGGIRCEKAIHAMERQGYENVFQLEGGILKYLEEYPEGHFAGECFVFDKRTAVDAHLQPSSRYRLCPHCGDPGDIPLTCPRCEADARICESCAKHNDRHSCSKNCAEMIRRQQA